MAPATSRAQGSGEGTMGSPGRSFRQRGENTLMYWTTSSSSGAGISQASMAVP
jgi:hypothetical protein